MTSIQEISVCRKTPVPGFSVLHEEQQRRRRLPIERCLCLGYRLRLLLLLFVCCSSLLQRLLLPAVRGFHLHSRHTNPFRFCFSHNTKDKRIQSATTTRTTRTRRNPWGLSVLEIARTKAVEEGAGDRIVDPTALSTAKPPSKDDNKDRRDEEPLYIHQGDWVQQQEDEDDDVQYDVVDWTLDADDEDQDGEHALVTRQKQLFPLTTTPTTFATPLVMRVSPTDATTLSNTTTNTNLFTNHVSYFYLKNELGLSEHAMWKFIHQAGSVLGMTAATIRYKVHVLQETLGLSHEELVGVLERQPTLLQLSADRNIVPTLEFIAREFQLTTVQELRALVLRFPGIIQYKQSTLLTKIYFWTRLMRFSIRECYDLYLAEPNLIRTNVGYGLVPRMRFFVRDLRIPLQPTLQTMVRNNPKIFMYSLDANLIPKCIDYMIASLHMTLPEVQKLLSAYPKILDYTLERTLLPTSRFLVQTVEYCPQTELRKMILKYPRLLTHGLSKIKHVVGYLRFTVGLNGSQVKRVLFQAPSIVGLSQDNLEHKLAYLQHVLATLKQNRTSSLSSYPFQTTTIPCPSDRVSFLPDLEMQEDLRHVVASMPTLLKVSPEKNLRPKLEYLQQAFAAAQHHHHDTNDDNNNNQDANTSSNRRHAAADDSPYELYKALMRLPTLLGYSLDQRIRPRLEAILQAGLKPGMITVGIPMKEEVFLKWLDGRRQAQRRQQQQEQQQQQEVPKQKQEKGTATSRARKPIDRSGRIVHWTRRP